MFGRGRLVPYWLVAFLMGPPLGLPGCQLLGISPLNTDAAGWVDMRMWLKVCLATFCLSTRTISSSDTERMREQ